MEPAAETDAIGCKGNVNVIAHAAVAQTREKMEIGSCFEEMEDELGRSCDMEHKVLML